MGEPVWSEAHRTGPRVSSALAVGSWRAYSDESEWGGDAMTEVILKIEGMSCQHCVMRVKKAVDGLAGVSKAEVSIGKAAISFDDSKIKREDIEAAVEKAGYAIAG
jgi:copper chaperone